MKAIQRFAYFLSPGIVQAAIGVALLPLSTFILNPEDFGAFALVLAVTSFLSIFGTAGAGYILSEHHRVLASIQGARLVSTLVWMSLLVGSFLAVCLAFAWPMGARYSAVLESIDQTSVYLAAVAMVLALPWSITVELLRIDGRAHWYAIVTIAQVFVSAATLLVCLYWFSLGLTSLFVSTVAGSFVMFVGAAGALRKILTPTVDLTWLGRIVSTARGTILGNLAESSYGLIERNVLSANQGLFSLGIYAHSQQYKAMASLPVSAIGNAAWPVALREANGDRAFPRTGAAWRVAHIALMLLGIVLATMGSHAIDLLTHGKFTTAYVLATLWVVYLIAQHTGKPQTATLYAHGKGAVYARIVTVSNVVGTAMLFLLIPALGVYGAFVAALTQQLVMRSIVHVAARRVATAPFQDYWAVIGACVVITTLWFRESFSTGFLWDMAIGSILVTALAVVGYKACPEMISILRGRVLR
jgi:O-antigen/teichoic acid export membrane protein